MTVDLANLSPWLLLAPLVMVAGYTVMGLSGFGSTIISVPILAHFLPISYVVPLMAVIDIGSSFLIGTRGHKEIATDELKRLLPLMFVGVVLGVTLLVAVPDHYLRAALGVFALAIGIHSIVNPVLHKSISRLWCIPAGLAGGAFSAVFGAGGPIYATYLAGRLRDKGRIRATVSTIIFVSAFSRTIFYAVGGLLLNVAMLAGVAFLAPFAWLGLKIGTRIHVGLTQEQMRRAVGGVILATGLSLLARAFL